MSIQKLKMLRDQAWIPTPLGDKFSLHFDDTLYLQLVAKHILDEVASYSCSSFGPSDLFAEGYQEGYNSAVQQITEQMRERYGTK
jgi:hypothetical protein